MLSDELWTGHELLGYDTNSTSKSSIIFANDDSTTTTTLYWKYQQRFGHICNGRLRSTRIVDEVFETRLTWFVHVKRKDSEHIGLNEESSRRDVKENMCWWDKEGREMKPVEATYKATGWTTKNRSELFCSDMFHCLRQQLVTEDDSSPRVAVRIRPTIASQSVSAHKSDNVTQVQRRRSGPPRESVPADEALARRRTERSQRTLSECNFHYQWERYASLYQSEERLNVMYGCFSEPMLSRSPRLPSLLRVLTAPTVEQDLGQS